MLYFSLYNKTEVWEFDSCQWQGVIIFSKSLRRFLVHTPSNLFSVYRKLLARANGTEAWRWRYTCIWCRGLEWLGMYNHSISTWTILCLILNWNKFITNSDYIGVISETKFQCFVMAGIQQEHPGTQKAINERSGSTTHPVKFLLGWITMRFGPVETNNAIVGWLQETHTSALAYLFPRPS